MTRAQEPAELRPGLPPVELRRVHSIWRDEAGDLLEFSPDGSQLTWRLVGKTSISSVVSWHGVEYLAEPGSFLAPAGASWSEVEALAAKAAGVR